MKTDDSTAFRHGYRLAIEMLRELEQVSADAGSLIPGENGATFREQPQTNIVLGHLTRVQLTNSAEVAEGFAAVLEDVLTTAQGAFPSAAAYREMIGRGVPHRAAGGAA